MAKRNEPILEPTTQAFIDSLAGSKPINTLSYADARKVLEGVLELISGRRIRKSESRQIGRHDMIMVGKSGNQVAKHVRGRGKPMQQ